MFLMVHNLCQTYIGLNPITLECEPFHNIISLYADVRRMQIRQDNPRKKKIIRRRASDDAGWW